MFPNRKHAARIAAADMNDVEREEIRAQVLWRSAKEVQDVEFESKACVRLVEGQDDRQRLAARGRHETDARLRLAACIEDVAHELDVAGVGREQRAAGGDDLFDQLGRLAYRGRGKTADGCHEGALRARAGAHLVEDPKVLGDRDRQRRRTAHDRTVNGVDLGFASRRQILEH